ncbi:MAG TPA: hypothetical protein VGC88_04745 [Terriglobales bacterium]
MKHLMLLPALALAASLSAQTSPGTTTTPTTRHARTAHRRAARNTGPTTQQQIDQLKQLIDQQQQQLSQLQQQLSQRDQQLQTAQQQVQTTQQAAQTAQSAADQANQKAEQASQAIQATDQQITDVKAAATNTNATIQEEQKRIGTLEKPTSLHYKGVTITPVGFFAAETVWREKGEGADINTSFTGIPLAGNGSSHLSEFFGTGRQSRLGGLIEGKYKFVKASGYFETDFLSAATTSNNNQSNSYSLRQRQIWAQAALDSGWAFTAGQMFTLATETKKGLDNRTEALPMTIDPQYQVGFTWARQYAFRVTKNIGKHAYLGASVENPQVTLTAHGQPANFVVGTAGLSGGLYNPLANYSFNYQPDYIVKGAFEPKFGHFEVFGIFSQFRSRVYPGATAATPTTVGAFNTSKSGQGIGANGRVSVMNKHLDLGVHYLGGDGVGRYGTSSLSDVTVRPDGTLATLRSDMGYGTIEFHSKKWDIYGYGGTEHVRRSFALNAAGAAVGYGAPTFNNSGCLVETVPAAGGFVPGVAANCNNDTRNIVEGTMGFWYKPFTGAYGRIQFGPQYSYVVRNLWTGVGGAPQATDNMFFTSFRYYLP